MKMEIPDVMFLTDSGISHIIDDVSSEIRIASSLPFNNGGEKYHHDRILKAKDAEIAELKSKLQRWEDAHSELIGEVELRKRVAELEAILEARGE